MSPGMLKAAAAGKVEFLIDQQQYLQGYLPIAIFGSIYEIWNNASWCGYDWTWFCNS